MSPGLDRVALDMEGRLCEGVSELKNINVAVCHYQNHYICSGAFQVEDTNMQPG